MPASHEIGSDRSEERRPPGYAPLAITRLERERSSEEPRSPGYASLAIRPSSERSSGIAPLGAVPRELEPQGDPRLMRAWEIRKYAGQGGLPDLHEIVRGMVHFDKDTEINWPRPLRQQGVEECQTVAALNGWRCLLAALGEPVPDPSFEDVARIREAAVRSSEDRTGTAAFDPLVVARLLADLGLFDHADPVANPIQVVDALFNSDSFAVVTKGFHATTVVPNRARLAVHSTKYVPPLVRIDSLTGQETGMGVEEFCDIILAQDPRELDPIKRESTIVCTMPCAE